MVADTDVLWQFQTISLIESMRSAPASSTLRVQTSVVDCTPGMRHGNFCDRLISRMTCGSKRKEPSVSDGGKIERSGVPKAAKAFCLWPASLGYRANFCTTGSRRAHGPEGLNRFPFSHKGRRGSSSAQF